MWLNRICNNLEIKRLYGEISPRFHDAVLLGLKMDYVKNEYVVQIEYYDWPTPLPEGWIPDKQYCGIYLDFSMKNVLFKYTDFNCLHDNDHCSIDIEVSDDGEFNMKAKTGVGQLIFELTTFCVTVSYFGYVDHRLD